jgi:hypothetical protein
MNVLGERGNNCGAIAVGSRGGKETISYSTPPGKEVVKLLGGGEQRRRGRRRRRGEQIAMHVGL